jgi:hypothetical protein
MRSEPDELLGSPDMVPGLTEALVQTLADPDQPAEPDNQEQ